MPRARKLKLSIYSVGEERCEISRADIVGNDDKVFNKASNTQKSMAFGHYLLVDSLT